MKTLYNMVKGLPAEVYRPSSTVQSRVTREEILQLFPELTHKG